MKFPSYLATLFYLLSPHLAQAVVPTPAEMAATRQWTAAKFEDGEPFFSFTYGGKPSAELLKDWQLKRTSRSLDDGRTEHTLTYTDPKSGLVVHCVGVEYRDFPVVEWTLYFKNTGKSDSPILADIRAIDAGFSRSTGGEFTLHTIMGDTTTAESYRPLAETLGPKTVKQLTPTEGRPTSGAFPYWNVATPGKGFLVVLGWPGRWSARFERDENQTLRIRAGQELTHFKLHPGEEVRSPLAVLQFYYGEWIRGQNLWRRWMVAHTIPRPDGKLVPTHYGACWSVDLHPNAVDELAVLKGYIREKIKLKYYFIDAGWYPSKRSWWEDTGTWEVDKTRFPKGIREVSDLAHAHGMGFVLWFEPERAGKGTWLAENHPEWILGGKNGGLVNLGNPDAWRWIVERIDSLINSEGVDVYRQDYNIDPLGYWRGADAPDRQGITEIKHLTGYLAFWDELLRRHPKLWIDTCASGGRRNDLETLRRSVPLLRSDYFNDAEGQQCQTYGLSLWVPYYGSGTIQNSLYWFRSCIFPASRVGWDTRKTDLDYPFLRRMIDEYEIVEPYLLGDYYPLTPYSLAKNVWIAWQFDSPEQGGGVVQAFRRNKSDEASQMLRLHGLDPAARYDVTDLDSGAPKRVSGKELMEQGLAVEIKHKPGAVVFVYQRAK